MRNTFIDSVCERFNVFLIIGILFSFSFLLIPISNASNSIISDDFNDNSTDSSLWTSSQKGSGPTITEMNQRLEIYFPANSADDPAESSFSASYTSVCTLRGDFAYRLIMSFLIGLIQMV